MEVWGEDLWEILRPIIVKLGPTRVLATLAEDGTFDDSDGDVDYGTLPNDAAIEMLDRSVANPESCAKLAAQVVAAFGKHQARREFDSGFPGSAQSTSIWRLGGWSFAVNSEMGVFEVYESAKEARKALGF